MINDVANYLISQNTLSFVIVKIKIFYFESITSYVTFIMTWPQTKALFDREDGWVCDGIGGHMSHFQFHSLIWPQNLVFPVFVTWSSKNVSNVIQPFIKSNQNWWRNKFMKDFS